MRGTQLPWFCLTILYERSPLIKRKGRRSHYWCRMVEEEEGEARLITVPAALTHSRLRLAVNSAVLRCLRALPRFAYTLARPTATARAFCLHAGCRLCCIVVRSFRYRTFVTHTRFPLRLRCRTHHAAHYALFRFVHTATHRYVLPTAHWVLRSAAAVPRIAYYLPPGVTTYGLCALPRRLCYTFSASLVFFGFLLPCGRLDARAFTRCARSFTRCLPTCAATHTRARRYLPFFSLPRLLTHAAVLRLPVRHLPGSPCHYLLRTTLFCLTYVAWFPPALCLPATPRAEKKRKRGGYPYPQFWFHSPPSTFTFYILGCPHHPLVVVPPTHSVDTPFLPSHIVCYTAGIQRSTSHHIHLWVPLPLLRFSPHSPFPHIWFMRYACVRLPHTTFASVCVHALRLVRYICAHHSPFTCRSPFTPTPLSTGSAITMPLVQLVYTRAHCGCGSHYLALLFPSFCTAFSYISSGCGCTAISPAAAYHATPPPRLALRGSTFGLYATRLTRCAPRALHYALLLTAYLAPLPFTLFATPFATTTPTATVRLIPLVLVGLPAYSPLTVYTRSPRTAYAVLPLFLPPLKHHTFLPARTLTFAGFARTYTRLPTLLRFYCRVCGRLRFHAYLPHSLRGSLPSTRWFASPLHALRTFHGVCDVHYLTYLIAGSLVPHACLPPRTRRRSGPHGCTRLPPARIPAPPLRAAAYCYRSHTAVHYPLLPVVVQFWFTPRKTHLHSLFHFCACCRIPTPFHTRRAFVFICIRTLRAAGVSVVPLFTHSCCAFIR